MGHPARPTTLRSRTFGAPRHYDLFANVLFFGRRQPTFVALIAAAGVQAGQRVLDVGCGTGYFAQLLAQTVGPDGQVVGIDPSIEMISYARRKRGRANCTFGVASAEALDFPADEFDVVVSSLVMHHVPENRRLSALREMRRVLRPGGTLLMADAQLPSHGLGWRLLMALTGHGRMARIAPQLEPLAVQAGFSEIRTGDAFPWLHYVRAVLTASTS